MKFRRPKGMRPLLEPVSGGSIDDLRPFVNVAIEQDWMLLVAWLLAALRPQGPYPLAVLHGEQGAAKTTTARVLRALVDPNLAPMRSEPRDPRDFMISASNGWVVAFDNLSKIDAGLSDALCRLSTGGGFATRTLFTNNHRVHQRLMYVLLSCQDGVPPKGKNFRALAEEAYRQIPPIQ